MFLKDRQIDREGESTGLVLCEYLTAGTYTVLCLSLLWNACLLPACLSVLCYLFVFLLSFTYLSVCCLLPVCLFFCCLFCFSVSGRLNTGSYLKENQYTDLLTVTKLKTGQCRLFEPSVSLCDLYNLYILVRYCTYTVLCAVWLALYQHLARNQNHNILVWWYLVSLSWF